MRLATPGGTADRASGKTTRSRFLSVVGSGGFAVAVTLASAAGAGPATAGGGVAWPAQVATSRVAGTVFYLKECAAGKGGAPTRVVFGQLVLKRDGLAQPVVVPVGSNGAFQATIGGRGLVTAELLLTSR